MRSKIQGHTAPVEGWINQFSPRNSNLRRGFETAWKSKIVDTFANSHYGKNKISNCWRFCH